MINVNAVGRVCNVKTFDVGELKKTVFSVVDNVNKKVGDDWVSTPVFLDCESWNSTQAQNLTKGDVVEVNGRLVSETFKNKEGEDAKKVFIRTNSINTVVKKQTGESADGNLKKTETVDKKENNDDIPF